VTRLRFFHERDSSLKTRGYETSRNTEEKKEKKKKRKKEKKTKKRGFTDPTAEKKPCQTAH
jgi:hypothetical protein